MQYIEHEGFVAPARARPELWRLLTGTLLALVVYFLGMAILFGLLVLTSGFEGAGHWMILMSEGGTPTAALLVLATFVGMGLGPIIAAKLLHKRGPGSLFGPLAKTTRHFLIAMAVCLAVYAISLLIPSDMQPAPNLAFSMWIAYMPLALVGILIQTGAEEVLFRGYLQQQLAARFAPPLIWMLLPSVLFALLHYQPAVMGDNAWVVVGAVFVFAVLAADLTAKTGSIGAAWGFHFANNTIAILFVALDGPLSGLALYTVPMGDMSAAELRPLLLVDIAVTTLIWGAIRLVVSRRD